MSKNNVIVLGIIGVLIVALVGVAFGLEGGIRKFSSEEILRINKEYYKVDDFKSFIKYMLYENDGKIVVDEETYADDLANGATKEDVFVYSSLDGFYQMKVYELFANKNNITLESGEIEQLNTSFNESKNDILAVGLTEEEYINIAKQQAIISKINNNASDYMELPDGAFDDFVGQFSGDDAKSYTYRLMQVGYTADKVSGEVSGESSGELIPGNRAEKEAYMNTLVARIKSGESFETVAESGDNRLIFVNNGLQFAKSLQEYSAGFLLEQKVYNEDLEKAIKSAENGALTEIIDTGDSFQVVLVEKKEDGIVGEAKDEVEQLLINEYASQLIFSVVSDMEVNNSTLSRIKVK